MAQSIFATNRRAKFDYDFQSKFTAGIVLFGHEVKSVRNGGADLKGSYITISKNGEAWLTNAHIKKYEHATSIDSYDPNRPRKLLLNKRELESLQRAKNEKLTIVPISIFKAGSHIKLSLATAKGKKQYDKRRDIKRRDIERQENRKFSK